MKVQIFLKCIQCLSEKISFFNDNNYVFFSEALNVGGQRYKRCRTSEFESIRGTRGLNSNKKELNQIYKQSWNHGEGLSKHLLKLLS